MKEFLFVIQFVIIGLKEVMRVLLPLILFLSAVSFIVIGLFKIEYPFFYRMIFYFLILLLFFAGLALTVIIPEMRDFDNVLAWFFIVAVIFFFFSSFTYLQIPNERVVIVYKNENIEVIKRKEFNLGVRPFRSKVYRGREAKDFLEGETLPFILPVL